MPETPVLQLPYPAATDPADVPADMQELAERIEAVSAELAYAQITATVPFTSGGTDVISSGAVNYDGQPVLIEFWATAVGITALSVGEAALLNLWDGPTDLGLLLQNLAVAPVLHLWAVHCAARLTPSPGSHTYRIRAASSGAAGNVYAGAGGAGSTYRPAAIRVTRA